MALTNLKRPKKRNKNQPCEVACSDEEKYPYGTRINLNDETLKMLGIKSLPKVGATMHVIGIGEVVSVSENESIDGSNRDVSIQIQKLEIKPTRKRTAIDAVDEALKED